MSSHKIKDRTPEIKAAGKLIPRGDRTKDCLTLSPTSDRPLTPERVRRFANATRPQPGEKRVLPSFALDSPPNPDQRHGVITKSSLEARELINAPSKTLYQQQVLDQKEFIYLSRQRAPLGTSHDQSSGLPKGLDLTVTRFGRKVVKDETAAAVVSPSKTRSQIEQESEEGAELYRKSHNVWKVGEIMDRNYDWSVYSKDSQYGVPTPHDNSGSQVKGALHWLHQEECTKKTPIISKRLDDFRERTQPQLGQVHDPIADTLTVNEAHTFGVTVQPDELSAGELLHMEGETMYAQCQGYDPGVMATIRNHLKKNKFHNSEQLLQCFQSLDKDMVGWLSSDKVSEICFQFTLPLSLDQLSLLVKWCSEGGGEEEEEERVRYGELVDLMNWQQPLTEDLEEKLRRRNLKVSSPQSQLSPLSTYRKSSEVVQTVSGVQTAGPTHRLFGVPTIRSDIPAPRIRRVADGTNYGDESDAYGLLYPSLYSNRGVFERDFFQPRPAHQIRAIFESIGVELSDEAFQQLWAEAVSRSDKGEVSVETFRALLEEVQSKQQSSPITST